MNQSTIALFPIAFDKHVFFSVFAFVFFIAQFIRTKQWYQLIMAIAIPASLLIYLAPENKTLFYGVGIGEAAALILALISSILQSSKAKKAKKAVAAQPVSEEQTAQEQTEA
ncbi:MAG: hypothetical protein MJ071_05390 [Oscillospiraceae bacterium]|nr:hypothetical protein [Oscillospiraceae bacterium]